MDLTRTSLLSGITRTRRIPLTPAQLVSGDLGHLTDSDRLWLTTGTTDEEWHLEFMALVQFPDWAQPN